MYTPFPHYEISKSQSKGKPSSPLRTIKTSPKKTTHNKIYVYKNSKKIR